MILHGSLSPESWEFSFSLSREWFSKCSFRTKKGYSQFDKYQGKKQGFKQTSIRSTFTSITNVINVANPWTFHGSPSFLTASTGSWSKFLYLPNHLSIFKLSNFGPLSSFFFFFGPWGSCFYINIFVIKNMKRYP